MNYMWDYLDKKTYNNRTGHYKYGRQCKFILDNSKNYRHKILDIGGGSGRFAIPLCEYSKDITVIDINKDAIRLLKGRNKKINAICGDFIETNLKERYSLLICIEVIDNFHNWNLFFNKINLLLADKGRFIFTYVNPNTWRFYLRKLRHLKNGPYPYNEVQFSELEKILNDNSLEIEVMEGMNWIPLPLTSNSKLVDFFIGIERVFNLKKWYSQSPWLLISIKKKEND